MKKLSKKRIVENLVYQYKKSVRDKEKSQIIETVFENSYKPYLLNRLRNDSKFARECVLQEYRLKIWHCLENFQFNSNFMTYLYFSTMPLIAKYFTKEAPLIKGTSLNDFIDIEDVQIK